MRKLFVIFLLPLAGCWTVINDDDPGPDLSCTSDERTAGLSTCPNTTNWILVDPYVGNSLITEGHFVEEQDFNFDQDPAGMMHFSFKSVDHRDDDATNPDDQLYRIRTISMKGTPIELAVDNNNTVACFSEMQSTEGWPNWSNTGTYTLCNTRTGEGASFSSGNDIKYIAYRCVGVDESFYGWMGIRCGDVIEIVNYTRPGATSDGNWIE